MKGIIVSILLLLSISGVAYGEDPDGFMGFKWGSSIEDFCKLENPGPYPIFLHEEDCKEKFTLSSSSMENERHGYRLLNRIGEVETDKVFYFFKKDKFYRAITLFRGHRNYFILKQALKTKYGDAKINPLVLKTSPNTPSGEECIWKLRSVSIVMRYNGSKDEGELVYTYDPIEFEKLLEDMKSILKTKDAL